jgi:hypothetical protein
MAQPTAGDAHFRRLVAPLRLQQVASKSPTVMEAEILKLAFSK